ncbi:hypothetical protein EDD18DRAFT_1116346 [Armillaria luteobubalina]|uniref:Uncharacterized protein n=1 Tax=Armillaria luteobubalina TaxID=153913 RepID=A0AA39UDI8_9AGAR|nr:hypothetical protein EDD18DRAFT_1116346 [Armillaria luteobubalina]
MSHNLPQEYPRNRKQHTHEHPAQVAGQASHVGTQFNQSFLGAEQTSHVGTQFKQLFPGGRTSDMSMSVMSWKRHVKLDDLPTPSEDEADNDNSMDDYYTQAELQEEDDDPDADMTESSEHPTILSHPAIATAQFLNEEDELYSSPVPPVPSSKSGQDGQDQGQSAGSFCLSAISFPVAGPMPLFQESHTTSGFTQPLSAGVAIIHQHPPLARMPDPLYHHPEPWQNKEGHCQHALRVQQCFEFQRSLDGHHPPSLMVRRHSKPPISQQMHQSHHQMVWLATIKAIVVSYTVRWMVPMRRKISHIEDAASELWAIINNATSMDPAITPAHIINQAFPSLVVHKMTHWNVFSVKYRAKNPDEHWDYKKVLEEYAIFKRAVPKDWKDILNDYAKILDLNGGHMSHGKCQLTFKTTFQEFAKQLDYHACCNMFEGFIGLIGANPKIDGPSIVAFYETELARGFANDKLWLKQDWAASHLQMYVQNCKSDSIISLHHQDDPQPEEQVRDMDSVKPPELDMHAQAYESSATYTPIGSNMAKHKPQPLLSIYRLYKPDNPKMVQLSCMINFCALLGPFPMTINGYPDYKSIPWKCLGPSLYEWTLMLTSWLASVPLPVTDKADLNFLSKSASSLTDSQKGHLAKALEDEELKIIPGHMVISQKPLVEGCSNLSEEYIFVHTNPDPVTNTVHEGVYSTAMGLSHRCTICNIKPTPDVPEDQHSNQMHTRKSTKAKSEQPVHRPARGEKQVAFEDHEASNDGDKFQLDGKKPKKPCRYGGKRQRHTSRIPSSMENITNAIAVWGATAQNNTSTGAAPSQVANSKQETVYYEDKINGSAGGGIYNDPGWNNGFNTGSDPGVQWD